MEAALISGILLVVLFGYRNIKGRPAEGSRTAVGGAILAAMNTASEYGFGAVIAALPGFLVLSKALAAIPDPLLNEAISITTLAGITGSASGGMSIALAAMSDTFIAAAHAANIPLEVFHRVASMASGGMDTLPHNGAVITLLAITGLSHRQAYGGIFAITIIKKSGRTVCHRRLLHHRNCLRRIIMNLTGKTATVTGSTSGIGLGIAQVLAQAGATLILNGFGDVDAAKDAVAQYGKTPLSWRGSER